MKTKIVGLILMTVTPLASARAEKEVGNGGDIVFCQKTADSRFAGIYALDYLVTHEASAELEPNPTIGWEEQLDSIEKKLLETAPDLGRRLGDFRSSLLNKTDL